MRKSEALKLVSDIALASAKAKSFRDLGAQSLRLICDALNWPIGHLFLTQTNSEGENVLNSAGIWHLRDPLQNQEFVRVTESFQVGTKQMPLAPQWRRDVRERNFERQNRANMPLNLGAAFNLPIVSSGKIIAVAEFFTVDAMDPDESILEIAAMLGIHLSVAHDLFTKQESPESSITYSTAARTAERMAALSDMANGVAHEINNPLTIIMGHINVIRGRMDPMSDPKTFESLDKIEASAGRIAKVVRELRNFSRDASNDPLESVMLNDVIHQTLSLCNERIQAAQVELSVKSNSTESVFVRTRGPQLCHILLSLLYNSLDAVVTLNQKWIRIRVEERKSKILILVEDSGSGISEAISAHMMEPFFTTKQVGTGTGLGLSSAKGLAESLGGKLRYDPKASNTTFVLELPKAA